MLNKLHGQPESYDKKSVSLPKLKLPIPFFLKPTIPGLNAPPTPPLALTKARSQYRFGKTLGAGTYGIVREADVDSGKVAVKIILKRNVKGNEQMVLDELAMLQKIDHPHIVRFIDWFESKVTIARSRLLLPKYRVRSLIPLRTNIILLPSSLLEASSSIEYATKANSLKRMHPRRSDKSSRRSTTYIKEILCTEVSM